MAVSLSPVFNDAQLDSSGNPFSGALLFTYEAGSSTKETTYQDSAGNTAHSNPIVLNSRGEPPAPIWLTNGQSYKFRLCISTESDPPSTSVRDIDNVDGVNDTTSSFDEWIASNLTPTFVGATQFTLAGDQTTAFHVGRRLKSTNTAGTIYSRISVASHAGGTTTITVVNDSGTLDSGLSVVSYGIVSANNSSAPVPRDNTFRVADNSDPTKLLALELSGITTATTRTITVPDSNVTLLSGAATQAEQETGSITTAAVTPGRQHFHQSAAKGWVNAGIAGAANGSYNVTSITDNATGDVTIAWGTDFADTNYCAVASPKVDLGGAPSSTYTVTVQNTAFAAGITRLFMARVDTGAAVDPNAWFCAAFGDFA